MTILKFDVTGLSDEFKDPGSCISRNYAQKRITTSRYTVYANFPIYTDAPEGKQGSQVEVYEVK
jgi:hypothetical protein